MYHKLRGKVNDYKNGGITKESLQQTIKSYEGVLSQANTHHLLRDLLNEIWIW
jgi:hypothetical protein